MTQGTDGDFYGTTAYRGISTACNYGCGAVFRLALGLAPFVKTVPTAGPVDTPVIILGQGFTSATAVAFGGAPAAFTVVSDTEITTSAPFYGSNADNNAVTGPVTVVTGDGILNSNVNFRVTPVISGFSPGSGSGRYARNRIAGASFYGATSVTFGQVKGSISKRSNASGAKITVTVPAGAISGKLRVTTPGGTATSAHVFKIN